MKYIVALLTLFTGLNFWAISGEPTKSPAKSPSIEKGKKALESTAFIPAFWPPFAYDNAWKQWDIKDKPANYDQAFRERYGLNTAPYENGAYPMGLREAGFLFGKGIGIDCMTCHGGSIMGKSIVGLGNTSLDIHSLFYDMYKAGGIKAKLPFEFGHVRGTNEAGAFGVYLLGLRKPDLQFTTEYTDLGLHDDSIEDTPAWWHLKKKQTMYYPGDADAKSVRALMQFMMHPLTTPKEFEKHEADFKNIQAYLMSIEPPQYPFEIDRKLAQEGLPLFTNHCARCHGTYEQSASQPGEKTHTYPNKIIPLEEIGTDPKRHQNIGKKYHDAYSASWFAQEKPVGKPLTLSEGYQAPPLDGIWATAPYLHNGSVPTLNALLDSKLRPKNFTRSYKTDETAYDKINIGWKVENVPEKIEQKNNFEQRKIYDTSKPGMSNLGHTYGDKLTEQERKALIEYLKTL